VTVGHTSADGLFTSAPFEASDLSLITNGEETNDRRFSYQWIRDGRQASLFAPADGVLVRIRHKTENPPDFPSDDYDLFFLVACDPDARDTLLRFNHVTDPRPDIKSAYAFGPLPAPSFNPFEEHEERQVPTTNIQVRAGELLGTTTGTPFAHNFDFMISVNNVATCPFVVLSEPYRSTLLGLLGPLSASPGGGSSPGVSLPGIRWKSLREDAVVDALSCMARSFSAAAPPCSPPGIAGLAINNRAGHRVGNDGTGRELVDRATLVGRERPLPRIPYRQRLGVRVKARDRVCPAVAGRGTECHNGRVSARGDRHLVAALDDACREQVGRDKRRTTAHRRQGQIL
jgi:hypothetical protein